MSCDAVYDRASSSRNCTRDCKLSLLKADEACLSTVRQTDVLHARDLVVIPTMVPKGDGPTFAVIETPSGIRHNFAFEPKYGIMLLKLTLAEGLT